MKEKPSDARMSQAALNNFKDALEDAKKVRSRTVQGILLVPVRCHAPVSGRPLQQRPAWPCSPRFPSCHHIIYYAITPRVKHAMLLRLSTGCLLFYAQMN